jgi:hypothetical protein
VWQALRNELHPKGFELVTVGLDTQGDTGCRAFIEAARPEHPSLIDRHHVLTDQFGVINIPSSVWIDENGMIVRPAEAAPAPPQSDGIASRFSLPADLPQRFIEIRAEAAKIRKDTHGYHSALGDAGCRAFIEAAKPQHPSLIDRHHVLADRFGVINIPSSVWIDENGMIVRPAETAPAPPQPGAAAAAPKSIFPADAPQRFIDIMT